LAWQPVEGQFCLLVGKRQPLNSWGLICDFGLTTADFL
jgi:hypothetical protein